MSTQELKEKFPELTQSVFSDLLRACDGDTKAAQQVLEADRAESDSKKRAAIEELVATFPDLSEDDISRVLAENGNNIELVFAPLLYLTQEKTNEKRRIAEREAAQKREAERAAQKERARAEATKKMEDLFKQISKAEIQRIIEEHDGDLEVVSEKLSEKVAQLEESERKEREAREEKERREAVFSALRTQIQMLSDAEIQSELEKCNYDLKIATPILTQKSNDKKTQDLARIYKSFSEKEIQVALLENGWDILKATESLDRQKAEKRKRAAEERRIRAEAEEQHKKDMIAELERVQRQKEEKERKKQEEILEKMSKINLDQSIMIQARVSEAVDEVKKDQAEQKEAEKEVLRGDIEKALRENPELQPGVHAAEQQPVLSSSESSDKNEIDAETYDFSSVIDRCKITISPERPDIGQDITVTWSGYDSPTDSDWISMNDAHTGAKITWNWVGTPSENGSVTFKAQDLGEVVFCYVNKSKQIMAKSKSIFIGPEFNLEATKIDNTKYSVKCTQISGVQHPNAWIGLFQKGAENENYYSYQWLSKAVNLSLTFDIPKNGFWEFRFFPLRNIIGKYISVASVGFNIEGDDKLELIIPEEGVIATINYDLTSLDTERDSVWVGLYLIQEIDNRQYRRYKNIRGSNKEFSKGTITFKKPIHSGRYEARLFAHGSLHPLLKSNVVPVEGI